MVFEFVERGAVLDIPTENPLTEDTAWSYFRDTLRGLEYCIYILFKKINLSEKYLVHYQKIVHRDIKPSNLLLSDSGHVKVS